VTAQILTSRSARVGGRSKVPITVQDADGQNINVCPDRPGTATGEKYTDGTIDVTLNGTTPPPACA
jgi:hypothetical protein